MIGRLALRSLLMHPIRTMVLACGFGLGVAVMANLLGVAEVVLEQSESPALVGGGDVVVTGTAGRLTSGRYLLWGGLGAPAFADRIAVASPTRRGSVFLVHDGVVTRLRARGGIPSLERALGDPETADVSAWVDAPGDAAWTSPDPEDVLRSLDRFHAIPDVPARAGSWVEWLYFNGQAGSTRFYLTFLVGPMRENGRRAAGVRLQLDRAGRVTNYGDAAEVDPAEVLARAPELTIGRSHIRLDGDRYVVSFDLGPGTNEPETRQNLQPARAVGEVVLTARRGQTLPPLSITGARGWVSGYVVPVMSGALDGTIRVGDEMLALAGGTGYHDHNWGFWEGVSWQWGQVQHEGLSILYGRVFPPADAADPSRIPGFMMVLGPDGPLGQATEVRIDETVDPARDRPARIVVRGNSPSLDLRLEVDIDSAIRTPMRDAPLAGGLDFLQMRGRYRVSGTAGGQALDFVAPGAAETFRGR
ncbi:MAG: hypothetical protein IT177_21530 [Acidobacteria bacterium]|nr:hypothetical protein [Acidobacteriota bacterium]